MRILHVVTAFPRTSDDVIVPWLVELLKRLKAAGHEVEVFTSSYRGAPDQVFAGIPVHRFRYFPRRWENLTHEEAAPDRMKRSLLYRLMPACFVVAGMAAIWRLCRRTRYDVIHVHWPLPLVGRLVERKGVAHLIEAIARLGRGDEGARLEIVGDGPERPGLEALAGRLGVASRVVFRGKIPPDELQASYARAAVCVLPSVLDARGDTEGLGVVLLEAMNHGTPVIASRVGGIPDIVEDGVSGLLVPPGDADALAAAVRRVRDDPDLARRLGEGGRRRLREQFNWPAIVRRWLDLYAGLVTRPRA